jgi:hypothetical protein
LRRVLKITQGVPKLLGKLYAVLTEMGPGDRSDLKAPTNHG